MLKGSQRRIRRCDLMSGYLVTTPDTSRLNMHGSLSRMKSARTGSKASGFTSGTDPSPSYRDVKDRCWLT